mgnify:CR=1 FL=1
MSKLTLEQAMAVLQEKVKSGDVTVDNLQAFLRGPSDYNAFVRSFPSYIYAAHLILPGGKVIEDVEPSDFKISQLKFVPCSQIKMGQEFPSFEVMRGCAVDLNANLGLSDAKYLLEHEDELPRGMQKNKMGNQIILPGTLLREDSVIFYPYLKWDHDSKRWKLEFVWNEGWRIGYPDMRMLACIK